MTERKSRHPRVGASTSRMQEPYLIISIDFGTTFSGVCWTWSGDWDRVHTIRSWPNDRGSDKVPTRIQYNDNGPCAWGFTAEDSDNTFGWFKLLLDYENLPSDIKDSPRVQHTYRMLQDPHRGFHNAVEGAMSVTVDYLEKLWCHAYKMILEKEGQSWICGMSSRTREAAERAISRNLGDIKSIDVSLVSEPEAAAHAVLQDPSIAMRRDLTKPQDIFLICDAGGGTVDAISYQVESLDPLKLTECVEGKGDLCGAIFIDSAFEQFLELHVGQETWASLSPELRTNVMRSQWEHDIKRQFDWGRRSEKWPVYIAGVGRGTFSFDRDEIVTLFQPTFSKIRTLIRQQIDQIQCQFRNKPKAIILVGGLGSSRYLSHLLRTEYHTENTGSNVEIRSSSDNDTWSAVCRGAVMATQQETVVSRVSRWHYGLSYNVPFEPENREHRSLGDDRMRWEGAEGRQLVTGKMHWIVNRGAKIAHIRATSPYKGLKYYRYANELSDPRVFYDLWVCGDKTAPEWKQADVTLLCTVAARLDVTFAELPVHTSPENELWRFVEVDLVMSPNGNTLEFDVYFQNRRLQKEIQWPYERNNGQSVTLEEDSSA